MNHRVAMVTSVHQYNDVRIYYKFAKTLSDAGWRVEIINSQFEGMDSDKIRFRRVAIPSGRIGRILFSPKLMCEALFESRADICILHDPELLTLIPKLKSKMPIQVVYDAHENLSAQLCAKHWIPFGMRRLSSHIGEAALKHYLPMADMVMAATEGIAENLACYGVQAMVVKNRPALRDMAEFDCALRSTCPTPDCVCYAGALTAKRGIITMIKACHKAGARLLLAGAFDDSVSQEKLKKMPEYSCVKYLGVLDRRELAKMYAACNAGLLLLCDTPAYRESEPIKLFEYLCAGLPVIASDFAHWREIIPQGAAVFVDPKDENAAAEAIENAIKSPKRLDAEQMRAQFGFQEDAKILLQLCDELEQKGRYRI